MIRNSFTHFLAQKQAEGITQRTLDNYLYSLQVFLADNGLDDTAEEAVLAQEFITKWVLYMQALGTRTVASINHYLRDMKVYCNFLHTFYNRPELRIRLLKQPQVIKPRYSELDLEALLEAPRATDGYHIWRTWLIISIMLATGARIGSVCRLKKEDINQNTITFTHTKNGNKLILPVSKQLYCNVLRFNSLFETDSEYLLISAKEGNELTPTGAYQALQDYCISRGVKCLGWHSFRHTFAYMAYKKGVDLVTLQTYLQHSSIELTRHYIGALGATDLPNFEVPLDCLCKAKAKKHIIKKKV